MKTKEDVIEAIIESIPGSFESVNSKEVRVPLENGKEVKLTLTVAKEALGGRPEFSNTPSDAEMDMLAQLINGLGV